MLCYYFTYHTTVMYGKFLMICLIAYNTVKVIVIILPNVIMISLYCLIHTIVMIKCLFCTTGIAVIWFVCVCTCNYISITLVINKFKYCSHITRVFNLNGNKIVKVNRTNVNIKCIVQQRCNNRVNMLHCNHCNGH